MTIKAIAQENQTKVSTRCNQDKTLDNFGPKKSGRYGVASWCKQCVAKYDRECLVRSKVDAINYLGGKCIDCGIQVTDENCCIFDFHHLDPNIKEKSIGRSLGVDFRTIIEEIDKCVAICGNCHTIRHWKEKDNYK